MITQWLDFIASAVGGAFAFICLFEGVRRMGAYGIHRAAALMAGFGAAFCLAYAGFSYWKYVALSDMAQILQKSMYSKELPTDWGSQVSPAEREASSLTLARMAFADAGVLRNYFDKTGKQVRFSPTEEDIKQRDFTVVTKARLEDSIHRSFDEALLWLLWAVIATALGFGLARDKGPLPANPTVERDARKSGARPSL
jgi:hypothetical protein